VKTAPPAAELRRHRATRRTHPTTTSRRCRTSHTLRRVRRKQVRELLLRPMNHTARQTSQHLRKLARANTLSQALKLVLQPAPRAGNNVAGLLLQPAADLTQPAAASKRRNRTGTGSRTQPLHRTVTTKPANLTGAEDVLLVAEHGGHAVISRTTRAAKPAHRVPTVSEVELIQLVRTENARNLIPQLPDAVVINRIHDALDRLLRQRLHLRPRPPDSVLAAFERVRDRLCNKVLHRVEHVTLHPSPHNMEPALDRVPLI